MKRIFIVFIILFLLMGVFSMDILGRNMTDIQRRMVGQTNYHINVVKGVVATVNINKTFGCYIAGETVIYPNIPTFSRDPKLQVGDKVTIEFINGCRETPVILAPEDIRERPDTTLPVTVGKLIFVTYYTGGHYYIAVLDDSGALQRTIDVGTDKLKGQNALCVGSSNNCFYINDHKEIVKIEADGTELLRVACFSVGGSYSLAIGADGYIYEFGTDPGWDKAINQLDPDTLAILKTTKLDVWSTYYGLTLDSDNNIYIVNNSDDRIEKWDIDAGYVSNKAFNDSDSASLPCLGILGEYIYGNKFLNYAWKIKKDFSAIETKVDMTTVVDAYGAGGGDGTYIYYTGYDVGGDVCISQCNADLSENWVTVLGSFTCQGGVAVYPF